jgi:octaprenyl-diphosphate synthase
LGAYIVQAGGKRLRPVALLLTAKAANPEQTVTSSDQTLLAAIVEFIHTATLLHDDVVDDSDLRRGQETASSIWGNEAAVLVGDYLYSRAFQMMVGLKRMKVMEILSEATNRIAQGEVMQLMNCNDPDTTEASYLEVIYSKTARLFEAATQLAAILTDQNEEIELAMQAYGKHLGTAFQLIDDVLDYTAQADDMGKNAGDDLAEGKPTLPLLHAMWHCKPSDACLIRDAIENANGMPHFDHILSVMQDTGSLVYTQECAEIEATKAKNALKAIPDSEFKAALIGLADLSVNRNY